GQPGSHCTNVILSYVKTYCYILSTLLIGAEGTMTPAGERGRGDPAGACAEEAPRTARGKRSAWSGNQQPSLTEPKN
ncbi:hypothetical protein V7659_24585, partial [Neobacillus drentensis]|uniref:hypothetical protein n=1 Tax=Neobacillus drentensis TaxID=220684 RepID=UPI002FFD869B